MGTLAISDGNNGLNYDINFINDSAFLTINPRTIMCKDTIRVRFMARTTQNLLINKQRSLVNGDYIYGQLERETGQTVNEYHILQATWQ